MSKLKPPADLSNFHNDFADFKRAVAWRFAQEPPARANQEVPETTSDPDLFRAEIAHRLLCALGCEPKACADHRCRRTRRCRKLQESEALLKQVRARVERERAAAHGSAEQEGKA